jgi:hypothetical protein
LITQSDSADRSPAPRQAIVFLTHIESIRVLNHYERLKYETRNFLDTFLCVHEVASRGLAPRIFAADFRISAQTTYQYAPKRYEQMLRSYESASYFGHIDLIFMPALSSERLRSYPYVWLIEYDVDFAGDWSSFFSETVQSHADYMATTIVARADSRNWVWWRTFRPPPGVELAHQARSFAPIARFSQRMLERYRASVRDGAWSGNYEALCPTIAAHAGFAVEDLGTGRRYTNTPGERNLSPGTFVWRPPVGNMYYHENQSGFPKPGLLYHPIKPGGK